MARRGVILSHPPAAAPDLALVGRVEAEEGARERGAARAHQPEQADDLAGVDGEVDAVQQALDGDPAGFEQPFRPDRRRAGGKELLDAAAEHSSDHPLDREVGDRSGSDELPVAQHRHVVGQRLHVAEDVRDVDDRLAVGGQPADQLEEPRRLPRGERCGRLVEDDDARVELQRLRDLHELALAGREALDRRVGRQVQADLAPAARPCARRAPAGRSIPPRLRGIRVMKMFSAIERLEKRLSSWWMKAKPARSASRGLPGA